jgi:hypothetical protein
MSPEEAMSYLERIRQKNRERQARYYQSNRDTVRERAKEYYKQKKERIQNIPSNTPSPTNATT